MHTFSSAYMKIKSFRNNPAGIADKSPSLFSHKFLSEGLPARGQKISKIDPRTGGRRK